jgi:tetratricopeptide (TPR) repeat protein
MVPPGRIVVYYSLVSAPFFYGSFSGSRAQMERAADWWFGLRPWRTTAAFALVTVGLMAATTWNVTRSSALSEAQHAYTRGDLPVCLQHSLDHLNRQPWSRDAALLAALCLSRLDYAEEAEFYYRRAGHLSLGDQQIRAYGLARGPHPERAIAAYNDILARWPENVTALRRLAAVELARNNTAELLKLAERLNRIAGGAVIGQTLRGVVYHNDSNPQQAVAAFERVLELDPQLREMPLSRRLFWSHLADDLIACGRTDDARSQLIKALENGPDADLMNQLGRIYFLQGALDDAERCYQQAAEWDPSDYGPHLNLAKLALQRRDRGEALKQLNKAKALEPRQYDVLYSLASVYSQLGLTADADRVQETLKQLRDKSLSPSPSVHNPWPRYAL